MRKPATPRLRVGAIGCFRAFTLIELMAVVLVIMLLAAIGMGVASYVQQKVAVSTARSQLAAIEAALEAYKSDLGYYPATVPERFSFMGTREGTNNWYLYRALSGANGGKKYANFPAVMLRTNTTINQVNICDPWGTPFNYYNSPGTPYSVVNTAPVGWTPLPGATWAWQFWYDGYASGGQVNRSSYDLMSYGPDKSTYVEGAIPIAGGVSRGWYDSAGCRWTNRVSAFDDITNFGGR